MSIGGAGHSNRSDDRTRVTSSLADPYNGRYSAKVNLASATPVRISLPVLLPLAHQEQRSKEVEAAAAAMPEYQFQLWVRSSPAGVKVEVASAMFEFVSSPAAASKAEGGGGGGGGVVHSAGTGWTAVNATLRLKKNASATAETGTAAGPPAKCNSMAPPYPTCDLPLEVKLTSSLEVGGTVFLDGISLLPLEPTTSAGRRIRN
jgi:hypothetical protein